MKILFIQLVLFGQLAFADDPVRIKNFREIYSSYETVMRVSGKDGSLQEILRLNKERLPRLGLPEELNSPAILAMTELGGAFCKKAIEREKDLTYGERTLFSDIDFERGPDQFGDYLKQKLATHFAKIFWQREIKEEELSSMVKLISIAAKDKSEPKDVVNILQMFCTSYATSLTFLVK